jgi:uncharacterized membrane-anchored protein
LSARTKVAFWLMVAAQIAILLAFVGVREYRLAVGTEVVLKTVPVDPRSLLQGDYAILRYEIGRLPPYMDQLDQGDTVYVMLDRREGGWRAVSYQVWKPETRTDELFLKGTVGPGDWLDFGIDTYFVPEGTGMEIQTSEGVNVKVAIDANGKAAIVDVYLDGESFTTGERLDAPAVIVPTVPPVAKPSLKPTAAPETPSNASDLTPVPVSPKPTPAA